MDIDYFVQTCVAEAALSSGVLASVLVRKGMSMPQIAIAPPVWSPWGAQWSQDEEIYLREQIGKLTYAEIGAALGRSEAAIKIRQVRKGMPAASKRPGWVTGHGAAKRLGVDIHAIMRLTERGILPHEALPGKRGILSIRLVTLYRWAVNPGNWIYFKLEKMGDARLRRLVERRRERWEDAWWGTGRVADWHGVEHTDVQRFIEAGKLPAVKWGNWWVKRSDATRAGLRFPKGKGAGHALVWSEAGDEFMLLATAVGLSASATSKMGGAQNPDYRIVCLRKSGKVRLMADRQGVLFDDGRGVLLADWRTYARRFPRLARAMEKFRRYLAGERVFTRKHIVGYTDADLNLVRGVLHAWAVWYARTDVQIRFASRLAHANHARADTLRAALDEIRSWGVDPLGGIDGKTG